MSSRADRLRAHRKHRRDAMAKRAAKVLAVAAKMGGRSGTIYNTHNRSGLVIGCYVVLNGTQEMYWSRNAGFRVVDSSLF